MSSYNKLQRQNQELAELAKDLQEKNRVLTEEYNEVVMRRSSDSPAKVRGW